jgi:hypothetical protein
MPGIQGCNRVSEDAFGRLEPCAVKVARTVLRGLGAGNRVWLPGIVIVEREPQSEPFVVQAR